MATAKTIKAEASDGSVSFPFGGTVYTVGSADEWSVVVLEAFEDGKIVTAVRALIGPEQWATFKLSNPTVTELNAFFDAAAEALGLGN